MIDKEKIEKRILEEYENFVFQGYTDAEISYMGTCLQKFVIERRSGPVNLKLEHDGLEISMTGSIAWGNGEPCPVCKQPFEKPDINHLMSHPEAQEMLFGKKG